MSVLYRTIRLAWRFIFWQTVRVEAMHSQTLERGGGYVLAVTHISHLEVVAMGVRTGREIRWIARQEFYRHRLLALSSRRSGAFA